MGGNNAFLKKQKQRDRDFFAAGLRVGMQIASDYITLALREPEIMKKDIFGRERIEKVLNHAMKLDDHFWVAFGQDVEADYVQEELDAKLREVYGDDLIPFAERYPQVRQMGYQKARKGWVD